MRILLTTVVSCSDSPTRLRDIKGGSCGQTWFKHIYFFPQDVEFKLLHKADLPLGKDVEVTLTATNKSEYRRVLTLVTFRFIRQGNHGNLARRPFKVEQIKNETELERNKGIFRYISWSSEPLHVILQSIQNVS